MAYIALKPCRFAGQDFTIGKDVPEAVLKAGNIKNLVKMGIIAATEGETATSYPQPAPPISVTIRAEEGDMPLELTDIGLQQIFDALTSNVENAEKIVDVMTDGDALILLHMSDSRKSIKAAAEARAKALAEQETDEEPAEEETPDEEQETSEDMAGEE